MATQSNTDRITPEHLYLSRRAFIKGLVTTAGAAALAACTPQGTPAPQSAPPTSAPTAAPTEPPTQTPDDTDTGETSQPDWPPVSAQADELGDVLTSADSVNTYNNFYEFSLSKEGVAPLAKEFVTSPWSVKVDGLMAKPRSFGLQTLYQFEQEKRIYRMRCVEA